jgi:7,8-dihydropterin-6-yl-methyl-4-(beta-D-ribofuranosyl)aminobenzene 5'-phosphate synthase
MTVHILYDNQSVRSSLESGWGFSCLIDGKILFDTGESGPALLKNLKEMDIAPEEVDTVVISHPHWDHTGGVKAMLALRPGLTVYLPSGAEEIFPDKDALAKAEIVQCPESTEVGPVLTSGTFTTEYKGSLMMEQGIVVRTSKGISLITGCAHPGIVRMAEEIASRYAGEELYTLLGGMHLVDMDREKVKQTLHQLKELGFTRIIATHCSGEIGRELSDHRTGVGDILVL